MNRFQRFLHHRGFSKYAWFRAMVGGDWYYVEVWGMIIPAHWYHTIGRYKGYSQVYILKEEHYRMFDSYIGYGL
jgi:hypothetical protein